MSTQTDDICSRIDDLVRNRSIHEAKRRISQLVRVEGTNPKVTVKACDWYFKLGMYREGLRLLERVNAHNELRFWAARFLNQLGASAHALALIRNATPRTRSEYRFIGGIYQANFEFKSALKCFERAFPALDMKDIAQDPMGVLSYSDTLAGLKEFDRAIELADRVSKETPIQLNRAIALQAKGEYLAMAGKFRKALGLLRSCQALIPSHDTSPDSVFLKKWLGFVHCSLGDADAGAKLLDAAYRDLRNRAIRDETWLHVLYLQAKVKLLEKDTIARLAHYPGLPRYLQEQLPRSRTWEDVLLPKRHRLLIDSRSNEYIHLGKRHLGLNAELELVAWVFKAGPWGLSTQRLSQLLWPDEPLLFLQHQQRIHQMLHRLRNKFKVSLKITQNRIHMGDLNKSGIALRVGSTLAPTFLLKSQSKKGSFSAAELSEYYAFSVSKRTAVLKEWLQSGLIERCGRGNYRVS